MTAKLYTSICFLSKILNYIQEYASGKLKVPWPPGGEKRQTKKTSSGKKLVTLCSLQ